MDDDQLDELLEGDRRVWEASVAAATTTLVHATREQVAQEPRHERRPRRRGLLVAGVVAGTIALTAGAGVAAAQLSIPPFQTTDPGTTRIATAIPIDYVESDGTPVTCKAFMEFASIDDATESRLMNDITTHDWRAVGQRAYDEARASGGGDASTRFGSNVDSALFAEAEQTIPGLLREPTKAAGVTWAGFSMSCSPQNTW